MTQPSASITVTPVRAPRGLSLDPVALAWLVSGRWATLAAAGGAAFAGWRTGEIQFPVIEAVATMLAIGASNLWLWWRVRSGRPATPTLAGSLVCGDVVLLSWLLLTSGGVLNPASVFYLVQIVLAALVLGRTWAWIVTALSIAGYAALFLTPTDALRAAQGMHPEIAVHMQGMWIAFALTALIIAVLVNRLVFAVERRDAALAALQDKSARAARLSGLTTVVAGAAHELSTPLATIAVAARELELALERSPNEPGLGDDARLIRSEIERCRNILNQMAGRTTGPAGESPRAITSGEIIAGAVARFSAPDQKRIKTIVARDIQLAWPAGVMGQALGNILQNGLQASEFGEVRIDIAALQGDRTQLTIADTGRGMSAEDLARAGEPFFTTKPVGSGMGLGLFVARATVEQLGGELALASTQGSGTTVTITMPRDVIRSWGTPHD